MTSAKVKYTEYQHTVYCALSSLRYLDSANTAMMFLTSSSGVTGEIFSYPSFFCGTHAAKYNVIDFMRT